VRQTDAAELIDDPLPGAVTCCYGADLARRVLQRVRMPRLQILPAIAHPQTPQDWPSIGVMRHVVVGIEDGDDAPQYFSHLIKSSKSNLNVCGRDNGGR
jgi:hypothetical protein